MSCGLAIGLILVVAPAILFQADPETPLGMSWEAGHYRTLCTVLGGIGGALMARRGDNNYAGYRWAAGMFGGALTSNLSLYASAQYWLLAGEASVNIFIVLVCSIPGLIVYAIVRRCSDRTFPADTNYGSSHDKRALSATSTNDKSADPATSTYPATSEYPATSHTPLLASRF
jgi:hypothetical protein